MPQMSQDQMGWVIGLAALGMMAGLIGNEVAELMEWGDAMTPSFIGKMLMHGATVVAAFVGGRLIPTASE